MPPCGKGKKTLTTQNIVFAEAGGYVGHCTASSGVVFLIRQNTVLLMSVFVCVLLLKQNENKREKVSSSTITTQTWLLVFVKKTQQTAQTS